jgi:signal transduction histidine kinase
MAHSLTRDIQKMQQKTLLLSVTCVILIISCLLWNQTVRARREQIGTLAGLVRVSLQKHQALLLAGDMAGFKRLAGPELAAIMDCYPRGFTAGFYSRECDRIILRKSNVRDIDVDRYIPTVPGRRSWPRLEPRYSFQWSAISRQWILQCFYPVVLRGVVVGHVFANITFWELIYLWLPIIGGLLVAFAICGYLSAGNITWLARKIQRNLDKLLLAGRQEPAAVLDYEELESIFRLNQKTYQNLYNTERHKLQMLENCPWGYSVIDSSGVYVDFNQTGAQMLGARPDDFIGRRVTAFGVKNPPLLEALLEKKKVVREMVFPIPESKPKILFAYCFPINLESGEEGAMSWFVDMTEQRLLEMHVRHIERLSAIGEMVSTFVHDVRNMLAAMKCLAQYGYLMPASQDPKPQFHRIDDLIGNVSDYLNRMLRFSRAGNEVSTTCSVKEMFDNAKVILGGKLETVTIVEAITEPEPLVTINQLDFQYVLLNLLTNALEAMTGPGEIRFSAAYTDGGMVRIELADNGRGIPAKDIPKIWNMFFTTKEKGTGIGLAVAKKVIEQFRGEISVSSVVDEGTTFTILLPAAK